MRRKKRTHKSEHTIKKPEEKSDTQENKRAAILTMRTAVTSCHTGGGEAAG